MNYKLIVSLLIGGAWSQQIIAKPESKKKCPFGLDLKMNHKTNSYQDNFKKSLQTLMNTLQSFSLVKQVLLLQQIQQLLLQLTTKVLSLQ